MKQWLWMLVFSFAAAPGQSEAEIFTFSDLQSPMQFYGCPKFKGGAGSPAPSLPKPIVPATGDPTAELQQLMAKMEKDFATMDRDSPQYKQMKITMDHMRTSAAKATEKIARAEARAAAPSAQPLRYVKLSFATAVASIRARLEGTLSSKTWQVYQTNQAINDPAKASAAAMLAMANGNRLAAAAALLRRVERNPKDVTALVNLAGVVATMGAPNEALALLDEADRLGTQPQTAWDLNAKAVKLNARGYALMGVGQAKEAEAALRESVGLEPQLAEAKRNLAAALGEQGKCAEGVRFLRLGSRRTPPKEETTPTPPPTPIPLPPVPIPLVPPAADTEGRPARDVLDFSRGRKNPKWPYLVVNVAPEQEARIERLIRSTMRSAGS